MSEQHAHPVALKAGEVPTINLWDLLDQAQAQERDLRAKLAAAEAECGRLLARDNEECCTDYKTMLIQQRDAARRDLREALEWMREDRDRYPCLWGENWPHHAKASAILARHEREERRKGERRQESISVHAVAEKRAHCSDRRQQPEAKLEETMKVGFDYKLAYHGACVDVARIRDEADDWKAKYRALSITLEQAEAKLATIKTAIEDGQSAGYILYLICGPEAAPAPPAPPAKVEPWPNHALNNYSHDWGDAVQRRIEALESQKARA